MKKIKILLLTMIICSSSFGNIKNDSIVLERLDNIKVLLDSLGVEEGVYVLAQAVYESGWFECKSCSWRYNNMFGFKGQDGKYIRFKTWEDCIVYYAKWQKARYPKYKAKYPNGDYLGFLKWSNFAVSEDYRKQIKWVYEWILDAWAEED